MKKLQTKHAELREHFLEELAEAIVLHRCPKIAEDGMKSINRDKAEKQLQQLISRERIRRMYRKSNKLQLLILFQPKGKLYRQSPLHPPQRQLSPKLQKPSMVRKRIMHTQNCESPV